MKVERDLYCKKRKLSTSNKKRLFFHFYGFLISQIIFWKADQVIILSSVGRDYLLDQKALTREKVELSFSRGMPTYHLPLITE